MNIEIAKFILSEYDSNLEHFLNQHDESTAEQLAYDHTESEIYELLELDFDFTPTESLSSLIAHAEELVASI